jgi:hypothetical protein
MLTPQQVLDTYRATKLPAVLTVAQKATLSDIAAMLLRGDVAGATAAWTSFCNTYITRATVKNVPGIEAWVLNRAYFPAGSRLQALVKAWEQKMSSLGDDAPLANGDLQNNLHQQQQTLQLLSNVSKAVHDTALATIRRIG